MEEELDQEDLEENRHLRCRSCVLSEYANFSEYRCSHVRSAKLASTEIFLSLELVEGDVELQRWRTAVLGRALHFLFDRRTIVTSMHESK